MPKVTYEDLINSVRENYTGEEIGKMKVSELEILIVMREKEAFHVWMSKCNNPF